MLQKRRTAMQKLEILLAYYDSDQSKTEFVNNYQISKVTLDRWLDAYRRFGLDGLQRSKTNRQYPSEIKLEAVRAYLQDGLLQKEVVDKFEIRSVTQLRNWIKDYQNNMLIKNRE